LSRALPFPKIYCHALGMTAHFDRMENVSYHKSLGIQAPYTTVIALRITTRKNWN